MFRKLNARRGQSTGEYAILVGVVIAAILAMQVYMRRSVQAHIKDAYDFTEQVNYTSDSGDNTFSNLFSTGQYEPGFMESSLRTIVNGSRNFQLQDGGGTFTNISRGVTQRNGTVTYTNATN